jgi:hypothetical protein
MFLVEQSFAGRDRQGRLKCYLIRGEVNDQFIHGYRYMTKEAVQLFRDAGLRLDLKRDKDCDAFLFDDEDDD